MYYLSVPFMGLANLLAGFVLAAPGIERFGLAVEHVRRASAKINSRRNTVGLVILVIGCVGLLNRLGIIHMQAILGGGGFPQSFMLIGQGLLIAREKFDHVPLLRDFTRKLEPYNEYIGTAGILFGIHAIF